MGFAHTERSEGSIGEAVEVDIPHYTGAIGVGRSRDLPADVGGWSLGENGLVGGACGIVRGDVGVAQSAGRLCKSDGREKSGRDD